MDSATKRKWKVIEHIRAIEKVPEPKYPFDPLNSEQGGISDILFTYNDKVHCDTEDCTEEELEFLWNEISKLGFKPRWHRK